MSNSTENQSAPLIGVNTLYTGKPEMRRRRGHTRDIYLVQHLYVDETLKAGGMPLVIPCVEDPAILAEYAGKVDGFLFIGGPDYPPSWYGEEPHEKSLHHLRERVDSDWPLIKKALTTGAPILGICAGAQLLNIALGGKLIQHLPNADEEHKDERYHQCSVIPETILSGALRAQSLELNSSHHQAIDPNHVGRGLRISAYAEDGTVEAVESVKPPFRLGVQSHLERHRDEALRNRVFSLLVDQAKAFARRTANIAN